MNRVEYSDIYKFITSVGLLFIGISFLFPVLVIQFSNSLIQADVDKWDDWNLEEARTLFIEILNGLILNIRIASIGIGVIGLGLFSYGIYNWRARQRVIDAIQNEDLKSRQLENLSPEAKEDIIKSEIIREEIPQEEIMDNSDFIDSYMQIENGVYKKLASTFRGNYEVMQNIQLSRFTYDIIMKSKYTHRRGDLIIEIKYYSNKLSLEKVRDDATAFIEAVKFYEVSQQRRAGAILIIVHDGTSGIPSHSDIAQVTKNVEQSQGKQLRMFSTSASTLVGLSASQIVQSAV